MAAKIVYIKAPFFYGCERDGVQLAPDILLEKLGKASIPFVYPDEHKLGADKYAVVANYCRIIKENVQGALRAGKTCVIMGGDHSIALGSVAGALEVDSNVGLIWFDAHADINTEQTTPSGHVHGMPVAGLIGLCESEINSVPIVKLPALNIFYIGTRDVDKGESECIEKLNLQDNVYSVSRVRELGMDIVMSEIASKMRNNGITNVHVSFDVDGMDPCEVAATGTPVSEGITTQEFLQFVDGLKFLPRVRSLDFVEYNPKLEPSGQPTGEWCIMALRKLICCLEYGK